RAVTTQTRPCGSCSSSMVLPSVFRALPRDGEGGVVSSVPAEIIQAACNPLDEDQTEPANRPLHQVVRRLVCSGSRIESLTVVAYLRRPFRVIDGDLDAQRRVRAAVLHRIG